MRPESWVVDMRHYVDEDTGDIPDQAPARIVNLVLFCGSIVAWVTDHLPEGDWHTNVSCRRSPGRTRCRGEITAELNRGSGYIEWRCTICGDNGVIHGWEHTLWDRSGPDEASLDVSAERNVPTGHTLASPPVCPNPVQGLEAEASRPLLEQVDPVQDEADLPGRRPGIGAWKEHARPVR
jgi:hypothetical protein